MNIFFIYLFWKMLILHALCDYPLQNDFLAKGKNHKQPIPEISWWICLTAHALIHSGAVGWITNNFYIGFAEFIIHWIIDYLKCDEKITFLQDQILHIICKFIWVIVIFI